MLLDWKPASTRTRKYSTMGYIYALIDPRDEGIYYVGRTVCALKKRLGDHLAAPVNVRVARWFDELRAQGLRPTIQALEEVAIDFMDEREQHWIKRLSEQGQPLTNRIEKGVTRSFTLRMPHDLDREVRVIARAATGNDVPLTVNAVLLELIREGLELYGEKLA